MKRPRLTYGAHAGAVTRLGLPLVGSHLAQMALHVTDTIFLGWYGVEELAAAVLGASLFFVTFILGAGFGTAVMGLVANAVGSGDEGEVRRATRMGIWLSTLFALAVMPLMWWSGDLLLLLGQAPRTAELAQDYLRIAGWGMVPALFIMSLKSCLAALGRTQVLLWLMAAGVVLNALLNWAFIFGNWGAPELGLVGAATTSLIVQILGAALLALYAVMARDLKRFELFRRFWRPDWQAMAQVFRVGLPIGFTGLAEGGLFQASALMMGWIGTMELAAHGIALEVAALAFMVHLGLSNAATIRAGRAIGARDRRSLRDGALVAIGISFGFGLVVTALFIFVPHVIIGLFLDDADPLAPQIIAFGTSLLAAAALFQLFDAMQAMGHGLLRGAQDTRGPMWISIFSYWLVGVPASYILAFPLGMGGVGLWLGLAAGLCLAAVMLMWRFWGGLARGRFRTLPAAA